MAYYKAKIITILSVVITGFLAVTFSVHANTPTISISPMGTNGSAQVNVTGDPNSSVTLYYQGINGTNYGYQSIYIGSTNYSGYFSTILSASSLVAPGGSVYVMVNGQQSQSIVWPYSYTNYPTPTPYYYYPTPTPYYYYYPTPTPYYYYPAPTPYYYPTVSPITFSQNTVSLNVGQSVAVSVYGGSGSGYYISYNSNSNAVQATISGSTLNISGNTGIAAGLVVCSSANSCGGLSVTVNQTNQPTGQGNWIYCASENQQCNFYGTQVVRYGANGNYYYRTLSNGALCSNAVFGDPAFGYVKQCYYGGTIGY